MLCVFANLASAADYFFDVNGIAPGSGITAGGSYDATAPVWNSATDGTATPVLNPGRQGYIFSAGTDAFGLSYTVTGSMGQVSQGITVAEGAVTLAGGGTFFGSTTVRTRAGSSLAFATTNWDFYNNTITFESAADAPISLNSISTTSTRGGNLVKTGPGRLTLTGNATANGFSTTVNQGELRLQTANALFSTGYSTKSYPVTVNTGGTLALTGGISVVNNPATLRGHGDATLGALRSVSGNNDWNALLTLGADTRINADADATLTLNPATGDAVTGAFALTLGGAGTLTVSRALSSLTALNKDGSGVAILAAMNPFTGPTTVSAGTLRFVETSGVLASVGGPLTVDATVEVVHAAAQTWSSALSGGTAGRFLKQGTGRLTLAGKHNLGGTVFVQDGVLALAKDTVFTGPLRLELAGSTTLDASPLGSGLVLTSGQTLAGVGGVAGALTTQSGAYLDATPGSPLVVTGSVAIAAGTCVRIPATLANGTYALLRSSSGVIAATPAALVLTGFTSTAQVASLQLNASSTELALVLASNPYVGRALVWVGDATGNRWETGVSTPWRTGGVPVVFTTRDAVTFDATGAAQPLVTLADTLLPTSVTVSSATDYTFTGSGSFAGGATLVKSGSGRLICAQANSFTGGTTLSGGVLEVRTTGALGLGPLVNSATLALAPVDSLTLANSISGSGSLSVSGGITTVTGDNTFTGPSTVASGTLVLGHYRALGAVAGATTVASGATLDLAGLSIGAEPVVLAGGLLRNSTVNPASLAGPLTLSAPASVAAVGAGELTLAGALGGTAPLTVTAGLVRLNGDSSAATVPVVVAAGSTMGGTGTVGGTLVLGGTLAPSCGLPGVATFSVVGNTTLQPGSSLSLRAQKSGASATADRLAVVGSLTLGGTLSLAVSGEPLAAGDSFTLFSAGSVSGSFAQIQLPYLYGDLLWDRSSLESTGTVRVISLPAVSTLAQRRDWLLTRLGENPDGMDGFTTALGFFARGDNDLGRAYALSRSRSLLDGHLNGAVQVDLFYIWPAVDLVARYGPLLDDETKANIRQIVLTFYQYKDTTTSNLKMLGHVVRFLGGELYGQAAFDAAKTYTNGTLTLTNDWRSSDPNAKTSLLSFLATMATTGVGELASRPYVWKNIVPVLSLAQLAQDAEIRNRAAIVYEACLAQHASYWLRGHLAMTTTRSYPDMLEQHPSSGASMGLFWYHFGGELPALDSESATMVAAMNPSVSPILELAASDRSTPTYVRSRNSNYYLHSWLDRDYALFADAIIGFNSGQVYPNGVVWTDSDRSRYSHLWVTKPIHDDPSSINVSNTHGKETRQFSETVAHDALLYIFNIPPPANLSALPTPTPYAMGYVPGGYRAVVNDAATTGQIFLHYGSVLIAIRSELPFGWDPAVGITTPSGTVRTGDSEFLIDGDTATTRPPATFTTPLTANLRFTVAIETARPADFPGATPAAQLAAFRTAILALPKPSRPADAPTTATYTTRQGDRLRLTASSDQNPVDFPLWVNDLPVDPSYWPQLESPWLYQPQGQNYLILRSPNRREVLNFSTWTRTVQTGAIDMTPPVLGNLPGNLNLTPTHPAPAPVFDLTAADATDGPVSITYDPPAGSSYTPGTTTIVTALATDAALNTALYSFAVTLDPYLAPPPASPWSVSNIGAQPLIPGSATHHVAGRVFTISGTGGTTGTGTSGDIWSGTSEGFTYVSLPWTGDGTFTARVYSLSATDSGAKAGLMFRETTAAGARNAIVYMSPTGTATFQTKTAINGNSSTSTTSSRGFPQWIRLLREGDTFTGYYSADGITWTLQGAPTVITMSGSILTVGFAVAPRTGGQTANAIIDNVSFQTPLDTWRLTNFGTPANTGSAADLADPDADSLPNLLEYAFGSSPTSPASSAALAVSLLSAPSSKLALTFLRARSDLTYTVEASSTLAPDSWSTLATNPGTVSPTVPVIVADTVSLTPASPLRFLRLRVTAP